MEEDNSIWLRIKEWFTRNYHLDYILEILLRIENILLEIRDREDK